MCELLFCTGRFFYRDCADRKVTVTLSKRAAVKRRLVHSEQGIKNETKVLLFAIWQMLFDTGKDNPYKVLAKSVCVLCQFNCLIGIDMKQYLQFKDKQAI